jgi:homoserine dehydrogenase
MGCRVGLIGVGTVGGGAAEIILRRGEALRRGTGGAGIELACAADLDEERLKPLAEAGVEVTRDAGTVVEREDIDVIVELIGGTGPAKEIVLRALTLGKSVVTANKALLASAGPEIAKAMAGSGARLGIEASVCGGVPVLGALRTGLVANEVSSVLGIVNGTCNYILSRMSREGASYGAALAEAQAEGYAEADPSFDVEGTDSAHKLAVLASLAFRTPVELGAVPCEGISGLDVADVGYAAEMGYVVKLLAIGKRAESGLELRVHPTLLGRSHPLAAVSGVFNAVEVTGDAVGKVMLYGRGAGRMPTASAVVADIAEIARGGGLGGPDLAFWTEVRGLPVAPAGETRTRFYVRFTARDEYGVLGRIARVLGEHRVSIASVIQKEPPRDSPPEGGVPIVMLTHAAREGDFRAALEGIDRFDFIGRKSVFLRVEEG